MDNTSISSRTRRTRFRFSSCKLVASVSLGCCPASYLGAERLGAREEQSPRYGRRGFCLDAWRFFRSVVLPSFDWHNKKKERSTIDPQKLGQGPLFVHRHPQTRSQRQGPSQAILAKWFRHIECTECVPTSACLLGLIFQIF